MSALPDSCYLVWDLLHLVVRPWIFMNVVLQVSTVAGKLSLRVRQLDVR